MDNWKEQERWVKANIKHVKDLFTHEMNRLWEYTGKSWNCCLQSTDNTKTLK